MSSPYPSHPLLSPALSAHSSTSHSLHAKSFPSPRTTALSLLRNATPRVGATQDSVETIRGLISLLLGVGTSLDPEGRAGELGLLGMVREGILAGLS